MLPVTTKDCPHQLLRAWASLSDLCEPGSCSAYQFTGHSLPNCMHQHSYEGGLTPNNDTGISASPRKLFSCSAPSFSAFCPQNFCHLKLPKLLISSLRSQGLSSPSLCPCPGDYSQRESCGNRRDSTPFPLPNSSGITVLTCLVVQSQEHLFHVFCPAFLLFSAGWLVQICYSITTGSRSFRRWCMNGGWMRWRAKEEHSRQRGQREPRSLVNHSKERTRGRVVGDEVR